LGNRPIPDKTGERTEPYLVVPVLLRMRPYGKTDVAVDGASSGTTAVEDGALW
jgi:hypothetical protein